MCPTPPHLPGKGVADQVTVIPHPRGKFSLQICPKAHQVDTTWDSICLHVKWRYPLFTHTVQTTQFFTQRTKHHEVDINFFKAIWEAGWGAGNESSYL